ncbi:UNVERIFIED_CONTAM: ATP synthase subunit b', chloroplastic [Sesamum calycinum]|uniref:ATP synthase subunit b', chloroplastic n=1 Tax=Sesamum calycinum TaxID=2727403 RepID=A0AAW2LYV6_9LAMI
MRFMHVGDIEVASTGTVAELKEAVEAAFDHLPKKGPGSVSWEHVWGQFCLCHEGQKLLNDSDYIGMLGIRDGDQLQFVHNASDTYNLDKEPSEREDPDSDHEPCICSCEDRQKDDGHHTWNLEDNQDDCAETEDGIISRCEHRINYLLRGWFPYRSPLGLLALSAGVRFQLEVNFLTPDGNAARPEGGEDTDNLVLQWVDIGIVPVRQGLLHPTWKFMDERDAAIREKLNSVKDTSAEVKQLEDQAAAVMKAARAEISAALNKMKKETQIEVEQKLGEGRKKVEAELQEALSSLEKQKEETVKALDSQIAALSEEIVKKVLPVS